jgi:hypothetical protein
LRLIHGAAILPVRRLAKEDTRVRSTFFAGEFDDD